MFLPQVDAVNFDFAASAWKVSGASGDEDVAEALLPVQQGIAVAKVDLQHGVVTAKLVPTSDARRATQQDAFSQNIRVPDARELQNLWSVDGAAC